MSTPLQLPVVADDPWPLTGGATPPRRRRRQIAQMAVAIFALTFALTALGARASRAADEIGSSPSLTAERAL